MLTMQQQNDLDAFIKNISPSLALRVRGHMFEKELRENNKIIRQTQQMIMKQKDSHKGAGSRLSQQAIEGPIENDS